MRFFLLLQNGLSLRDGSKMKCDDCGSDIEGTYFQQEGRNICEKDYEKASETRCRFPIQNLQITFCLKMLEICYGFFCETMLLTFPLAHI